jgi:hypothetical protein
MVGTAAGRTIGSLQSLHRWLHHAYCINVQVVQLLVQIGIDEVRTVLQVRFNEQQLFVHRQASRESCGETQRIIGRWLVAVRDDTEILLRAVAVVERGGRDL